METKDAVTPMPMDVVSQEAPVDTPQETFDAPERTTPKFVDEYVPPALRPPLIRGNIPTASPGFWEGTKAVMDDSGFASNIGRVYDDWTETEDQDFHVMQAALPSILTKYDVNEVWSEQLLTQAKNTKHMETLAQRIQQVTAHRAGSEGMSIPMMLATEVSGFALDPTNFIPSTLVVKGAPLVPKLLPKVAARFTEAVAAKMGTTKLGTMGIYAAFGAAEEAIRLSPRLASDPTYNYEQYLLEVGMGSVFTGAIPAVPTAYRWGKSAIAKPANKLAEGMTEMWESYVKSTQMRTGVNVMKQAVKSSKKAAQDKNIKAVFDEIDPATAARKATDDFNARQAERKVNTAIKEATQATVNKFKAAVETGDEASLVTTHAEAINSILDTLPEAERKAAKDAMESIVEAQKAAELKVAETPKTKVEGEPKPEPLSEVEQYHTSVSTLMKSLDKAEQAAIKALDEACK